MSELKNRLQKRFKHLKKWAKKQGLSCYRLYEKDLPDYPMIIDYLDGDVVMWIYDRTRDDAEAKKEAFLNQSKCSVLEALSLNEDQLFIKQRGKQKGLETQYTKLGKRAHAKIIQEQGLRFELNLSDYLDTGLFLDHRLTRKMFRDLSKGKRVLNLFAYTGSFTCYAIDGGASSSVTVDLNKNYIHWAKRNVILNGFEVDKKHLFVVEDCLSFLKKDKCEYDLVICDPPTFSNSKKMAQSFNIDDHYPDLITKCLNRLSKSGALIFSTNSRSFSLDPKQLPSGIHIKETSSQTVPDDFRNKKIHRSWIIQRSF